MFYRSFMESILQKEVASKEDIIAIESIRQKYHIPLSEHLSILSDIEDGVNIYTRYLEEYEVIPVIPLVVTNEQKREISMIYFSETGTDNMASLIRM